MVCFQREKQQKLNELDVVVVLKLHQIQYVVNSVLPQDLSQCLVFNSPGLVRLQNRIKELEKEKAEQKRLYRYAQIALYFAITAPKIEMYWHQYIDGAYPIDRVHFLRNANTRKICQKYRTEPFLEFILVRSS